MKSQSLIMMLFAVVALAACNKDNATPVKLEGTYAGTFTSSSVNAANGTVKVVISGKTYQATLNTFMTIGSRGSYTVNNNQLTFQDSLVHTANFDWGLLLNGTYIQTTKDDSLILEKRGNGYSYVYRLKKQ
jgi:major membrane immunogen (membrane-anchored lipoprotein)